MNLKIKKIIVAVLILQLSSYLLIGDFMLEKQVLDEFQEFSKRRLASDYNLENSKINEEFIFSSCGDEFFRNNELLKEQIKNSNLNRYEKLAELKELEALLFFNENESYKPINIYKSDYHVSPGKLLSDRINGKEEINVITFTVCRINKTPFISSKIEITESFSTHTDFHAMLYNEQLLTYEVTYIWALFKWVRVNKTNEKF